MILPHDLNDSFEYIYRYEKFLFFRNWGIVLLIFGTIEFLNSSINLINTVFKILDPNSSLWNILQLINIVVIVLSLLFIIKSFYYSKETKIIKKKVVVVKRTFLGTLFIIIWSVSFIFLKILFFDPIFANRQFSFISPLLLSGLMFIGSYYVIKQYYPDYNNKELLITGIALILFALISFVITQQFIDQNPFAAYDNPFDFLRELMGTEQSSFSPRPYFEIFYFHTLITAISFIILGIFQLRKGNYALREDRE
ncbi:MAG: hypothetical protein HeimC3_45350 [Candidatus Heimdallarchaeota archaeon LC_3]|nr:MAG: hypothetical protein HeimC3_45350 [Candidatus Heimdallarchaeota archaeon LC_3]